MGAIAGLSLGVALKKPSWARFLTLAGAIGFSIGYVVYRQILDQQILGGYTHLLIIWGVIGGALLVAALGYLEKKGTK